MRSPTTTTTGYVYVPDADSGIFTGAAPGTIVRMPDRSAPWIVVDHTIESTIVTCWPGRLWRVVVLDTEGIEQASAHANYTRALAVRIIEEVPAQRLFGEHGEVVVTVFTFASRLDADTAERLREHRHPEADRAYSRAWRRWLDRFGGSLTQGESDISGTLAAGPGPVRLPLGSGLSLVHRAVWNRVEAIVGAGAFIQEEEGERTLGPVWGAAASALLDAAMALGAPVVASEDAAILLAAWRAVTNSGNTPPSTG